MMCEDYVTLNNSKDQMTKKTRSTDQKFLPEKCA